MTTSIKRTTLGNLLWSYFESRNHEALDSLQNHVRKGEFRDEEIPSDVYSTVFQLLKSTVDPTFVTALTGVDRHRVRDICLTLIAAEEFTEEAWRHIPVELSKYLAERATPGRINSEDLESEYRFIQTSLLLLYRKFPKVRSYVRKDIGKFLRDYAVIPTRSSHLTPILNVLHAIISGMSDPDPIVFREILLPLHRPNGWSFWDRQTPILAEYHKPLVQCCYVFIERDHQYATELVEYLLTSAFPPVHQANTAKELLLLFEINKFINFLDLRKLKTKFFAKLLECLNSENAQIVQSGLTFWKSPPSNFPTMLVPYLPEFMDPLVMMLFRGSGEPHWNPTVNKMTLLVLKNLKSANPELFKSASSRIPPTHFGAATSQPRQRVPSSLVAEVCDPTLGVTGIAPWIHEPELPSEDQGVSDGSFSGIDAMEEYMRRICPTSDCEAENSKSWHLALSSETPTLLPDLKFHNLVFGRDLGSGAFSTVRYARIVKPKSSLSQWDEVAVKVINFQTIVKVHYGENILREICCLRQLAHPSIARLISSFKWRDGIYLVLEYGSLGDLHSYIRSNGPIDSVCAKIVIGEIATALVTVHECGFVYGDLKPENVVITATRHIKLADFGACRPVTFGSKNLVIASRDALTNMRSGDWKETSTTPTLPDLSLESVLNPSTFEGTSAYLSPEVTLARGTGPTVLSDAWALGMTLYYVTVGRLAGWSNAGDDDLTSLHFDLASLIRSDHNIASFENSLQSLIFALFELDTDKRLSVEDAMTHEWFDDVQEVRSLYKQTLSEDHLRGVSEELNLKRQDSQWEKRQLSKIWTAQPVDFALKSHSHDEQSHECIMESDIERNSPFLV